MTLLGKIRQLLNWRRVPPGGSPVPSSPIVLEPVLDERKKRHD